jgi:hypothetical protein
MVSHVDTRATITSVRTKLSSLDQAMREHDSDFELFNGYVIGQVAKLHDRGEQPQDLLDNLFRGCMACKDTEFADFIKKKEGFYEEGGQVEYQQLMDWALNKFKNRKESEQWCQRTTEGETIIALQAQVKPLISNLKKSDVNGKSVAARKDQKKANKKGKGKFKPEDKPALMRTPPNEGERHSKTVEGKDYHWCPDHESWTRRKPSECKGIGFTKTQAKKDLDKVSDSKPKMKLSPPSPPMKNDGHAQLTASSLGPGQ